MTDPLDERLPFLRGDGRYLDDMTPAGCQHVAFVRSPHPRATITAIDAARALAAPGVKAVVVGRDLAETVRPIEARMDAQDFYVYRRTAWPVIAIDRVRFVGEIVAAVVASDPYLADDARALVDVTYEPAEAVADPRAALEPDAPRVHADLPDNALFTLKHETEGGAEGFAAAPVRIAGTFRHPRVSPSPMECSGVIASHDRRSGRVTLVTPTQVPHIVRDGIARCLGLPESAIRITTPDVGGAFGVKMQLHPEDVVCAYLARTLDRPVKWVQDRREHLQTGFQARDAHIEAVLAADEDGRILGLEATLWTDAGAYSSFPLSCSLEPHTAQVGLPGPYDVPYFSYKAIAVATNKCPTGAYRGVGFALGPLVTENLIDKLARRLGLDRMEVRRRNLVGPGAFPFKAASGAIYDSGDYPSLLAKAIDRAGYDALRAERDGKRAADRRLGLGIACFIEPTGMGCNVFRGRGMREIPAFDSALVRVGRSGHVEAHVTTPDQGQQQYTSMRRLLARQLGISPDRIVVRLGDTDIMPHGSGTFASRGTVTGGGALQRAGRKLIERMTRLAAIRLGVDVEDVVFEDGRFGAGPRSNEIATFDEIAEFAHSPVGGLPAGMEHGLQCTASFDNPGAAVSSGAHIAVIEVDTTTGAVAVLRYVVAEDCGPIVNLEAVEGQVRGAVTQGIGAALLEEVRYGRDGQHLSGTLADYLMPLSPDAPEFDIVHQETPSPLTEGGYKGMGESGTIGGAAAIASAVMDALDVDWSELRLPLEPERVLSLLAAGGALEG